MSDTTGYEAKTIHRMLERKLTQGDKVVLHLNVMKATLETDVLV